MKKDFLFPYAFRKAGWFLLVVSTIYGLMGAYGQLLPHPISIYLANSGVENSFYDELSSLGVICGLMFVAFSREKHEDEMTEKIRLESLQWSVYINYFLLFLAIVFVYGIDFILILEANIFTVLIVFIIRFRWYIARLGREESGDL